MGNSQGDLKKEKSSKPVTLDYNPGNVSQTTRPASTGTGTGATSRINNIAVIPIHTGTSRPSSIRPINPPIRNFDHLDPSVYKKIDPPKKIEPKIISGTSSYTSIPPRNPPVPKVPTPVYKQPNPDPKIIRGTSTSSSNTSFPPRNTPVPKVSSPIHKQPNPSNKIETKTIYRTSTSSSNTSYPLPNPPPPFPKVSSLMHKQPTPSNKMEPKIICGTSTSSSSTRLYPVLPIHEESKTPKNAKRPTKKDNNKKVDNLQINQAGTNNNNNNRGGRNRGRGGNTANTSRTGNRGNRGNRGNQGNRGNNNNRGRNPGPGLLPMPGTSQQMDWFNMTPASRDIPPLIQSAFAASDLPIRNNYGGRYNPNNDEDTRSESNQSNRGGRGGGRGGRGGRPAFMGFKKLEEIYQMEPDQIVMGLRSQEAGLEKLLKTELSGDYIVLVIRVISKCCQTTFQENKANILARMCEKDFTDQLIKYLNELNLHERPDRVRNKYFWESEANQNLFWTTLIEFYESVIQLIPNTAVEVLPKMLKQTILTVGNLETVERIPISESVRTNLEELQMKLLLCQEEREKKKKQAKSGLLMQDEEPPDDFRQISLYPMIHEITDRQEKVFLRANIIDGRYQDVDHYLDVHFRLLREDFVAPLRNGICDHLHQQLTRERKRIFNVRFYDKVMFVSKYSVQDKVAVVVQLNVSKRKIKLENTRRFMFGSLLCFTNNNFQSVIFGTVVSRDRKLLEKHQIAIDLINEDVSYESQYTMVECNVYFEPYYHVLKALQEMREDKFPLKRYIIDVEPDVRPPGYLTPLSIFEHRGHAFYALEKDKWPSARALGLDASQYRAFAAALTNEFCVMQGPPGTGKTYVGLRITQVLLENRQLWNARRNPILVVCFTNHALDQFLEGICEFTKKLVRIGGQSKNEKLNPYNLREMRSKYNRTKEGKHLNYQCRMELKHIMNEINSLQGILGSILECDRILDIRRFKMIDERIRNSWFETAKDQDLLDWLMGGRTVEERYQERKKQRFAQQNAALAQAQVQDKNNDDSEDDSEDEYFDPDEEARRRIDEDDDIDHIFHSFELLRINAASLLTQKNLKEHIYVLSQQLDDLTVKAEETNQFAVYDERGDVEMKLANAHEDYNYFNWRMEQIKTKTSPARPANINFQNPLQLTANERWGVYAHWLNLYRTSLIVKLNQLHEVYRRAYREFEEFRNMEDLNLMRDMHVVGMTTTGAARHQALLQDLKCPIVIVEEAAEVLESHIVVSLTKDCQHLILIGDHKQLRPTTSEYRLAKDCHLDISLFERMVTNKIHCETLEVQHRMRPEIVRLIVPAIYPKLESYPTVYTYPPVQGVTSSLFFITHTEPEEAVDDSGSRKNVHEAKFLIKLARHFILQGYEPEDITILAAYSGQMFCLWKERKNLPLLKDVRITGVDNFQGEENKIILLSLVRSNAESNIGFLKTDNRVNVALSRAKEGLFIIGNMSILEKSDNAWPKIKRVLEENNQIGSHLTLQCQVHRDQLTPVRTANDFQKVTEGGCTKLCGSTLNCGHICRSLCHVTDREHLKYKCKENCTKGLCEIGHPCPLRCYEKCRPCEVLLPVILACGHEHNLPCHMNDTSTHQCTTLVDTKLECGHVAAKPCYRNVKKFPCPHPCDVRKLCGHACERRCHIYDDPDHLQMKCFKQCGRTSRGCTQPPEAAHKCLKPCFEECMDCEVNVPKTKEPCGHVLTMPCRQPISETKCEKRCKNTLNCGHKCKLDCWEECGRCDVKTTKILESCGHPVKSKCSEKVDRSMCHGKCPRPLPCGHPCNKKCNEPCNTSCTALVDSPFKATCGHKTKIPCNMARQQQDPDTLLKYCQEPCNAILKCEHICVGTCGTCAQGRIHKVCLEKCGATLICGHACDYPCREICQPCNKKCYYRCSHSKCGKQCGEPCAECKERCDRRCIHQQCTRLCSEPCNVPPCEEPCPRLLRCKHPCIGFCGEPCPPICRVCNADDEAFEVLFGSEDEPDARFVYLEECKHVIEADGMEMWLSQKPQEEHENQRENRSYEINVKCCPKCKTIIMTQRYAEYIKQVFRDIIAIKKKVYLEDEESSRQRADLQMQLAALRQDNFDLYRDSKYFEQLIKELLFELEETHKGKRNTINKLTIQSCNIKIQLTQRMINILNKGDLKLNQNFIKCLAHFDLILSHLTDTESRISQQKIEDLELEISRLERFVHLFTIEKNPNFAYSYTKPTIKALYTTIYNKLKSVDKYCEKTDTEIKGHLEHLRWLVDKTMTITEEEKEMIVQAVGLAKGRWYKCPNGHFYAIGECGGAMEIGKCNECGADIGGENHLLLETNQFGGEMDGAAHPAWSNAANLANYDLDLD